MDLLQVWGYINKPHAQEAKSGVYFFFFFFSLRLSFERSLRLTEKFRKMYRDFSYDFCPYICIASTIINIPHQNGTFVTIDEPTWTPHIYQSLWFTLRFTLGVVQSVSLDKYMMTCIHHYGSTQNIFITVKILYILSIYLIHLSPPLFLPTGNQWTFLFMFTLYSISKKLKILLFLNYSWNIILY